MCPTMRGTLPCTPRTWWCVALRRMSPCPPSAFCLLGLMASSHTGAASRRASAAWSMCRSCGRRGHPSIIGGREFTSFFSGWGMLAHRSSARRNICGGLGTIKVRWPGAHAEIGRRRAFVCPLVGRSRGSLWSCFRGRLVGHGMLACPTDSMVEPDCRCRFLWSQCNWSQYLAIQAVAVEFASGLSPQLRLHLPAVALWYCVLC